MATASDGVGGSPIDPPCHVRVTRSNATFVSALSAAGVDPRSDRLSDQLSEMPPEARLRLAVNLVDTVTAAHRVGLNHGNLHARNVLVGPINPKGLGCAIDLTGVCCFRCEGAISW